MSELRGFKVQAAAGLTFLFAAPTSKQTVDIHSMEPSHSEQVLLVTEEEKKQQLSAQ